MNRKEFAKKLMGWFDKEARDLPWRRTRDPYKIWISEIMLQQTTVATVIPYYERWIRAFATIKSVAKAPLPKILKMWQGLGYYQRARNLHKSALEICRLYKGQLPQEYEILHKFPGFGPYTTAAVLSIAFDQRYPLVDANVRRVMMRQLALKGHAGSSCDAKILKILDGLMPKKRAGIFNQALMELGALVCRSVEPLCSLCPVQASCLAFKKHLQDLIPETKKKQSEKIEAVCGIIRKGSRYFIQKRSSQGLLADLWEFPGGKVEKGEESQEALRRELKEELNIFLKNAEYLFTIQHAYTKFKIKLDVWLCDVSPLPPPDGTHHWASFQELAKYPLPSATAAIIARLKLRP